MIRLNEWNGWMDGWKKVLEYNNINTPKKKLFLIMTMMIIMLMMMGKEGSEWKNRALRHLLSFWHSKWVPPSPVYLVFQKSCLYFMSGFFLSI